MAEFEKVMKDWGRMCKDRRCDVCRLSVNGICNTDPESRTYEDIVKIENVITEWAAEHPEPVYPTWKEWLEEQRVVVHFDSVDKHGIKVKWELTNKSNCHIPADIAEKLGIEPKEG